MSNGSVLESNNPKMGRFWKVRSQKWVGFGKCHRFIQVQDGLGDDEVDDEAGTVDR
jgi:hypothetical protein